MSANKPPESRPLQRGCRAADLLYRLHYRHLKDWLRRRYGDGPPEPEDVAQGAFAKISAMENLDHVEDQRAFLYTIAANLAVSGFRSRERAARLIRDNLVANEFNIENLTPERVLEGRDDFAHLMRLLSGLSDRQREIVQRSRLKGQTYAQISAETGWSLGTISSELRAALQTLASVRTTREDV